jgi:methionine aminotransferase
MEDVLTSKLPNVGTTIFAVMSGMAREEGALNLSQGFPDFEVDPALIDRVEHYMRKGFNQYAPMPGVPKLREAISHKIENLQGHRYDYEKEINITAGATQAIYTAISAVVQQDDEVLLFAPAYDCYEPAIEINGGKSVYATLRAPDYRIDWDEVEKLVSERTAMIVINSPHNPTGSVIPGEDLDKLAEICERYNIWLLSDEVYEHIVFDGQMHHSAASHPGLVNRSFVIGSFGKTFHATGWKLGYCCAPEAVMKEFRKVHQYVVFAVNHPVQLAVADHLAQADNYLSVSPMYQEKRDRFLKSIEGTKWKWQPSSGTYFQLLQYGDITDRSDTDISEWMTREMKLASIPISVFYPDGDDAHVLRFCFAKNNDTLDKAAEILKRISDD